eukprot:COSAG01_NODE_1226_length_11140_cov_73.834798_16_plen_569_part_00
MRLPLCPWLTRLAHMLMLSDDAPAVLAPTRRLGRGDGNGGCTLGARGILIHGAPGSGKSHLLEALLQPATGVAVIRLPAASIVQPTVGASLDNVAQAFAEARRCAPAVVLIEELDALGAGQSSQQLSSSASAVSSYISSRLVACVAMQLDELALEDVAVVAIGVTSRLAAVPASLRRAGRFEVELEMPPLGRAERHAILQHLVAPIEPPPSSSQGGADTRGGGVNAAEGGDTAAQTALVARLVDRTFGFTPGDLSHLCREAVLASLSKARPSRSQHGQEERLLWSDFEKALGSVRPACMRLEVPNAGAGTGGTALRGAIDEDVLRQLDSAVTLPLTAFGRAVFQQAGMVASRGVLLHGPAGNGKTWLAHEVGQSSPANFIHVSASEIMSPVSGASEKNVSAMFERARRVAPSLLFIDELENLVPSRGLGSSNDDAHAGHSSLDRVLSVFLTHLDGMFTRAGAGAAAVMIIGATRTIGAIDPAILRAGRIDSHIYVGPPGVSARANMIRARCAAMGSTTLSASDLDALVSKTSGWSRAEIDSLCREAAMRALREDVDADTVQLSHFMDQ